MNEMVKIQHQQWARDLDDQRRSRLTQVTGKPPMPTLNP